MTRHPGALPVMTVRHDDPRFGFPHGRSRRRRFHNKIPFFFPEHTTIILYKPYYKRSPRWGARDRGGLPIHSMLTADGPL